MQKTSPRRRSPSWPLPDSPYLPEVSGYTVAPAGPVDPRNSYVPPVNAVFVVDNAKGQISMCYPDSKDNKVVVICTPATKLPQ